MLEGQRTGKPPILLRLTPVLLSLLKSADGEDVRIQVDGPRANIMVGSEKFPCTDVAESDTLDAFVRSEVQGNERFEYAGRVAHRIIAEPSSSEPSTKASLTGDEIKLAHCLAVGPMGLADLANRVDFPMATAAKLLERVAQPILGEKFELIPTLYQKLNIREWKLWSPQEKAAVISNANRTFDHLGYPRNHPARLLLQPPDQARQVDSTSRAPNRLLKISPGKLRKTVNGRTSTPTPEGHHSSSKPRENGKSTYLGDSSKPPLRSSDEDMFKLARRFRDAYDDYYRLYSVLSKRKVRSPTQVQKLLSIHRELEQWKRTLWENAKRRKAVA